MVLCKGLKLIFFFMFFFLHFYLFFLNFVLELFKFWAVLNGGGGGSDFHEEGGGGGNPILNDDLGQKNLHTSN